MRLFSIVESTVGWVGPMKILLGSGRPYTLTYGTGGPGRPPFLYVPIPLSVIRSQVKHLERATAWYDPTKMMGGISTGQVNATPNMVLIPEVGKKLRHVGEAHFTVSMGPELFPNGRDLTRQLQETGLCRPKYGTPVEVHHTGQFKVMRSLHYMDQADPDGPYLIAEAVRVPELGKIRQAIGLPAQPSLPPQIKSAYVPHITIGYAANSDNIYADYIAQHGKTPRHKSRYDGLHEADGNILNRSELSCTYLYLRRWREGRL